MKQIQEIDVDVFGGQERVRERERQSRKKMSLV